MEVGLAYVAGCSTDNIMRLTCYLWFRLPNTRGCQIPTTKYRGFCPWVHPKPQALHVANC